MKWRSFYDCFEFIEGMEAFMGTDLIRRKFVKSTSVAIALFPIASIIGPARASVNTAMRAQVKYQDTPLDGKSCASCLEFIPGKNEKDLGGCKRIPGDDEISSNAYCNLWNTM
jgi:hypothetical protein